MGGVPLDSTGVHAPTHKGTAGEKLDSGPSPFIARWPPLLLPPPYGVWMSPGLGGLYFGDLGLGRVLGCLSNLGTA